MASETLNGLKVAILVTDGFEQVEMTQPRRALDEAGANTRLVSPKDAEVKAWNFTDWGDTFPVDVPLGSARTEEFDALLLPGGVINPDTLRMQPEAVAFAKGLLRRRQAGGVDLPRTLDHHRGGCRSRQAPDVLAVSEERPSERRRAMGRSRGRGRSRPGHEPQARRYPGLQPGGDQSVRGCKRAIAAGGGQVRAAGGTVQHQPSSRRSVA